jgi:hypothetical protein
MMGWGDALIEMEYNVRRLEAELQRDRLVHVAKGATSRLEKESLRRRLAWRAGDFMAGLWCWWQRRTVAEPGAAAC